MVAVILQFLGQIQESFTLRVDVQLAVDNPAGVGAVLDGVPDVAVTGDDGIALFLQSGSSLKELVPALGASADGLADNGGIVRAKHVLSDGAAIDERTAGGLIAKADDLAVRGTSADLDGVGSDLGSSDGSIDVDAQILVGSGEVSHVALGVLQDESGLGAVQIGGVSAAGSQSLVQRGLVQTVGGGDDGGLDLILVSEVGVQLKIAVDHLGDLIRERHHVDDGLAVGRGHGSAQRNDHDKSQNECEQFFHVCSSLKK